MTSELASNGRLVFSEVDEVCNKPSTNGVTNDDDTGGIKKEDMPMDPRLADNLKVDN